METLNVLAQIEQEKVEDKSSNMNSYFYNVKYKNLKNIDKEVDKIFGYLLDNYDMDIEIDNIDYLLKKFFSTIFSLMESKNGSFEDNLSITIASYIRLKTKIFIKERLNVIKNGIHGRGIIHSIDIRKIFKHINKELENGITITFTRKG